MLKKLENHSFSNSQLSLWITEEPEIKIVEKVIYKKSNIEEEFNNIDINNLTPIEALNLLNDLKNKDIA
jgi:DNA mismatch repair protein MutS